MATKKKSKPVKAVAPAAKTKPLRHRVTAKKAPPAEPAPAAPVKKPPHRFKPGQSGNPQGGRLHNPELRKVRNLTKQELADVGNLIIKNDFDALRAMAKDAKATVLQRMLSSVAVRIIDKGDMGALDILLNRLVGKVKDEVAHSGNLPQVVVSLPSNGREAK